MFSGRDGLGTVWSKAGCQGRPRRAVALPRGALLQPSLQRPCRCAGGHPALCLVLASPAPGPLGDLMSVREQSFQQHWVLTEGGPRRVAWPNGCLSSNGSYDDRSSDRRAYDRRYCGSYRRNDYSRDRGDAYYDADYRHSYEYHREDSSYRSQRSSRRRHRRHRRRSRTFSRSSSVSARQALPLPSPPGPRCVRSVLVLSRAAGTDLEAGASPPLSGSWRALQSALEADGHRARVAPRPLWHAGLAGRGAAPAPEARALARGPACALPFSPSPGLRGPLRRWAWVGARGQLCVPGRASCGAWGCG